MSEFSWNLKFMHITLFIQAPGFPLSSICRENNISSYHLTTFLTVMKSFPALQLSPFVGGDCVSNDKQRKSKLPWEVEGKQLTKPVLSPLSLLLGHTRQTLGAERAGFLGLKAVTKRWVGCSRLGYITSWVPDQVTQNIWDSNNSKSWMPGLLGDYSSWLSASTKYLFYKLQDCD